MVADCDTPTYATDQLVCADAELKAMDAALRAALAELDAERINAPPPFVERQSDWFKRRSRCAFAVDGRACTQDAYAERLAVLGALKGGAPSGRAVSCDPSPPEARRVFEKQDLTLLTASDGAVVAVALPPVGHSSWRPFVQLSTRGHALRFERADGRVLVCR